MNEEQKNTLISLALFWFVLFGTITISISVLKTVHLFHQQVILGKW